MLRILSRRVLPVMHLYKSLPLLLHLLIGSCPVLHPVCLFSCDVDVQFSLRRFGDCPDGLEVFGFLRFAIFASR